MKSVWKKARKWGSHMELVVKCEEHIARVLEWDHRPLNIAPDHLQSRESGSYPNILCLSGAHKPGKRESTSPFCLTNDDKLLKMNQFNNK